ncbi:MAG: NUDIX domain-containing protein [Bacteroidota bacterium]
MLLFCFQEAAPVLDGNVFRVVARYFGVSHNIADAKNKKSFYEILEEVIDRQHPDQFNQAIMEFGALHCTPAKPLCMYCDLRQDCHAFQHQKQQELPVKIKKLKIKRRNFQYVVFVSGDRVYMKERGAKDIWQGLHDFYLLEQADFEPEAVFTSAQLEAASLQHESIPYKHLLTHQRIEAQFFVVRIRDEAVFSPFLEGMQGHQMDEIANIPKPKLIDNYLNEVFFSLDL